MRRAILLGLAIALAPGCLCLQTPNSPEESAGGGGHGGGIIVVNVGGFDANSTSTGTGGGGAPSKSEACIVLTADGEAMGIADVNSNDDGSPALVAIDEAIVGVAFTSTDAAGHAELRLAQFAGWKAWPLTRSATMMITKNKVALDVEAFVAGPAPADTYALFYRDMAGALFASEHAFGSDIGTPHAIGNGGTPLFIRTNDGVGALLGFEDQAVDPVLGEAVHTLGIAADSGNGVSRISNVACSMTSISADAVPISGGTLFAAAVGQPLSFVEHPSCADNTPSVEASTSVALASISKLGVAASLGSTFSVGGIADRIALAPRSDGLAWLVVGTAGTLESVLIDGAAGGTPVQIPGPADLTLDSGSFGATTLGNTWVVAAAGIGADGQRAVSLARGDLPGWTAPMPTPGIAPGSPIAILSDSKSQVLVAWAGDSSSTRRIHVARFHCGP